MCNTITPQHVIISNLSKMKSFIIALLTILVFIIL